MSKATDKTDRYARYSATLAAAYDAADRAQSDMVENMRALDCGFAWVVVRDTAFMTWARAQSKAAPFAGSTKYYGSKHYAGGWCFWCPGSFNGQSIGIHEAGARAFRDIMAHGLQCNVEFGSRLD